MVTGRVRVETLEDGRAALAGSATPAALVLEVAVDQRVPAWLGDLVALARSAGASVSVVAVAPSAVTAAGDEALAGWEIGVCTAALAAGADEIVGIDPTRVARVRTIVGALATGSAPVPVEASEVRP